MEKDPINLNDSDTQTESRSATAVAEPVHEPRRPIPDQPRQDRRTPRQNTRRPDNRQQEQNGAGRDNRQFRDNQQRNRRPSNQESEAIAGPKVGLVELEAKSVDQLRELASEFELAVSPEMEKPELVFRLLEVQAAQVGFVIRQGVLDIIEDGFGFLRQARFLPAQDDVYVSQSQIRRFALRTGDHVVGQVRAPKEAEKYQSLLRVEAVNGQDPEAARQRPHFDKLTPIFPDVQLMLETQPKVIANRIIDLVAPIGRGQRGLIVSPPKAGKTTLLKQIAAGITANYDDVHLMMVLIGERPEEVTDIRRSVKGEVIASTFDEPVEDHAKVAEMALERAKRLVESGKDVVILMDSVTRLARAYNLVVPPSGRTLTGGIDPVALYPPKRFFGAARNLDEGGSLTVIATCLVETGSRMDDVIYEEFKGTGNMELHLDRKLQERRVFPAIDIGRSSTRRDELLIPEPLMKQVWTLRRMVGMLGGLEGTELVLQRLGKTESNADFLATLTKDVL